MLFKKNERLSDSGEERGWENPELILFDICLLLNFGFWGISRWKFGNQGIFYIWKNNNDSNALWKSRNQKSYNLFLIMPETRESGWRLKDFLFVNLSSIPNPINCRSSILAQNFCLFSETCFVVISWIPNPFTPAKCSLWSKPGTEATSFLCSHWWLTPSQDVLIYWWTVGGWEVHSSLDHWGH